GGFMQIEINSQPFISNVNERVPINTSDKSNRRIHSQTLQRLNDIGHSPIKIDLRLWELEKEWDIERVIEAQASSLILASLALGVTVSRKWFALPVLISGFLLQHAIQGWCPPVPFLRRLGFRTQREIDNERIVLLARRGQLENLRELPADAALKTVKDATT